MGGKFAMLNALHAKHVLFSVNVPMWEVSILKKQLFQAGECGSAATPRWTFSRSEHQRENEAKCGAYLMPILTR
jgi:hypothetical protein